MFPRQNKTAALIAVGTLQLYERLAVMLHIVVDNKHICRGSIVNTEYGVAVLTPSALVSAFVAGSLACCLLACQQTQPREPRLESEEGCPKRRADGT